MVIQRMVMKDILYSVEEREQFQGMMVDDLGGWLWRGEKLLRMYD